MFKGILSFVASLLLIFATYAETSDPKDTQPKKEEKTPDLNIPHISEAFGHLIGKNLESLGFEFDMTQVIKGIQDSIAGKESPMSESECVQAISLVQESVFQKSSKENLEKAESFLAINKKAEGIVEIEKDKLQYKVEKKGTGLEVQPHFSPIIRYTGRFIDGKVFGASKEDEMISLDETIPGFAKGVIGMQEGEKRTLFIHPELGYGTSGYLPPNSSLIFEVEIVKANAPQEQQESITSNIQTKASDEIASIEPEIEAVR